MSKVVQVGVCAIVTWRGQVLLGKRKGSHGAGTWAPPGGHLEFGETFEECAIRETLEETQYILPPSAPAALVTNCLYPDEDKHYVTVGMRFAIDDDTTPVIVNTEPEKCEGWQWFAWTDLPEDLFPSFVRIRDQWGHILEELIGGKVSYV